MTLVLARWEDVEDGDTVWHNDALWRITGGPFHDGPQWARWHADQDGGDHPDNEITVMAMLTDKVAVVVDDS